MFNHLPDGSHPALSPTASISRRALLVDEVEYHLALLEEMLRPLGFDATYAGNLMEARTALEHVAFDVIFLDSKLPDGFGGRFVSGLPNLGLEHTPPVVAMTATDDPNVMLRFFSAGAEGFAQKPLTFESVRENLCRCGLLDPSVNYDPPIRSEVDFTNIHFMSKGDLSRALNYLVHLDRQLEIEIGAVIDASLHCDDDLARKTLNRLLSLTPFAEAPLFTSVVESCQAVAQCKNYALLRSLVPSLVAEHKLIKTALQDEIHRCQPAETPSRHKSV